MKAVSVSGTMIPWVGRGLEASFSVATVPDGDEVTGALTYQWYRVNPATFEMAEISGETNLTYITTEDDAGYYLICRATADGINAGGFHQVISKWDTWIRNDGYISDVTDTGFTLNLKKGVSGGLMSGELELTDWSGNEISITSVTQGETNAKYIITADIAGHDYFMLQNTSKFWKITREMMHGMLAQGVCMDLLPA